MAAFYTAQARSRLKSGTATVCNRLVLLSPLRSPRLYYPRPDDYPLPLADPQSSLILAANMRPVISVGPPAAGPMIKRTDLAGNIPASAALPMSLVRNEV